MDLKMHWRHKAGVSFYLDTYFKVWKEEKKQLLNVSVYYCELTTSQSNKNPTLVSNGNIQERIQVTQVYACLQIQGTCLCLWDPFFQLMVPKSQLFSSWRLN